MKLVHVIPNFHNPAGCTLSAAKRERLVELAAEHGFWILEDDPYRELPFDEEPPPTMLAPGDGGRVIHASSFSKTVSPGVRVGYLAGPADEIAKLAKRANELYISPNMLAEAVVYELCRSGGLDENIAFVKGALKERRDTLVDALREQVPEADFVEPGGGYFLWLTLERGRRHDRAQGRRQGGGRRVHRRARLHARRRPLEPATLVRERPPGPDRRGRRPHRPCSRAGARRQPGLSDPDKRSPQGWPSVHRRREQTARIFYPAVTCRLADAPNLARPFGTISEEATHP